MQLGVAQARLMRAALQTHWRKGRADRSAAQTHDTDANFNTADPLQGRQLFWWEGAGRADDSYAHPGNRPDGYTAAGVPGYTAPDWCPDLVRRASVCSPVPRTEDWTRLLQAYVRAVFDPLSIGRQHIRTAFDDIETALPIDLFLLWTTAHGGASTMAAGRQIHGS